MAFDNGTNRGRVEKIISIIDLLRASKESNRASDEQFAEMIAPAIKALGIKPAAAAIQEEAPPQCESQQGWHEEPPAPVQTAVPDATPPIAREVSGLEHVTTQQLVDRMIACGALLASRRK